MLSNYEYFKSLKICVQCMRYSVAPGRVRCEVCLAQNAEASERKIRNESSEQSEERKRKHREYLKRIRKERKERGVCIFCERPLAIGSTVYCIEHKIKNQRANEKKHDIARTERKYYGKCYLCGEDSVEGKNVCRVCYEKCCSNLPESKGNSNYDYWKRENRAVFRKAN